jgi:hypothetical protein
MVQVFGGRVGDYGQAQVSYTCIHDEVSSHFKKNIELVYYQVEAVVEKRHVNMLNHYWMDLDECIRLTGFWMLVWKFLSFSGAASNTLK